MATAYRDEKSWTGYVVLSAITGAHILAFILWPTFMHQKDVVAGNRQQPIFLLMLPAATPVDKTPTPPQRTKPTPAAVRIKPKVVSVVQPQAISLPVTPPQAQPTALVTPPEQPAPMPRLNLDTLRESAKHEAGKIDRDMRKANPQLSTNTVSTPQLRLQAGIDAAYAPHSGPITLTNFTLPDGRPITKVSGPFGSYCIYQEAPGLTHGRDAAQSGVMTKVTNCPK